MGRLPPTLNTVKRLFALSGNVCAFPSCDVHLVEESGVVVGEICHIEAAEPGGPRFNPQQSIEDRREFSNLLLLCANHHHVTDASGFDVQTLQKMKASHEARFLSQHYHPPERVLRESIRRLGEPAFRAVGTAVFSLLNFAYPEAQIHISEYGPWQYRLAPPDIEVIVAPIRRHHRDWSSDFLDELSDPWVIESPHDLIDWIYDPQRARELHLFLLFEGYDIRHSDLEYKFRQFGRDLENAIRDAHRAAHSRHRSYPYLIVGTFDHQRGLTILEERYVERVFPEFSRREYSRQSGILGESTQAWYCQQQEDYRRRRMR